MNLVRRYKLSKLGIDNLSEKDKEIINFVNSKIYNLSEFIMEEYPNIIFYMNVDGEVILLYGIKHKILWARYPDFWRDMHNVYRLKYEEVESIIQYLVRNKYKIEIDITDDITDNDVIRYERDYKSMTKISHDEVVRLSNQVV